MIVETLKENLSVNKLVCSKKEIIFAEGDMIVPDSKPDILDTICTSGIICLYKKEVLDGKVRLDGNVNTYIMYLADDSKDRIRALNTSIDFSENIELPKSEQGMECKVNINLKSIEAKVVNGRKISIKATMEVELRVYSREDIEIINDLQNADEIQMLKEKLKVNSLLGIGDTKIYAKDNISIDQVDNLAEILKASMCICEKDIKISYNKVLSKAEAEIKIVYLTEDNRINKVTAKIPIVGFVDIQNISENNTCDVEYEIRNMIIKPNQTEEHSIYVELEVGILVTAYEEKEINLIQDLYSPCENLEFNKKQITTMTGKMQIRESKSIRETINIENLGNRNIIDVDIVKNITNENKLKDRIVYEGELEFRFLTDTSDLVLETKTAKIPFEHIINNIQNAENMNTNMEMEIANQDYIIQDNGDIVTNVDMLLNTDMYQNANLNIMDEIQTNGTREEQDYSLIMYIVKKDDTLWNIAKRFGSTVDDIVRANGIENPDEIQPGQKLFIPRYKRAGVEKQNTPMVNYV